MNIRINIRIPTFVLVILVIFETTLCTTLLLTAVNASIPGRHLWALPLSLGMLIGAFMLGILCGKHEAPL